MKKLFISYARENKGDVDQLVEHLRMMGYDSWVDVSLRAGQDWWKEILRRIAEADAFVAVVSRSVLDSTACHREFEWAEKLSKPVLPVAVDPAVVDPAAAFSCRAASPSARSSTTRSRRSAPRRHCCSKAVWVRCRRRHSCRIRCPIPQPRRCPT